MEDHLPIGPPVGMPLRASGENPAKLPRPTNIRQVADAADVSIATVSRVLNSPHLVTSETAERVMRAVKQFGYSPNRSAQALSGRRRSYAVGVVLQGDTLGHSELMSAVTKAARRSGYHVVAGYMARPDPQQGAPALPFGHVDGLAILTGRPGQRLWEQARAVGVPIVTFDPSPRDPHAISVSIDHSAGIIEATTHLLESVLPTDCFLVDGDSDLPETIRHATAFLSTIAKTGHTPDDEQTAFGADMLEWGSEWAKRVLDANPRRPIGVIAGSPEIGYAIINAFTRAGKSVPLDLRIVVVGEHPMSALVDPPLSTVNVPIAQAADTAIAALISRIEKPQNPVAASVWVTSLIVRASSKL